MEVWRRIPSLPSHLASSEGRVMVVPYISKMPNGGSRYYGGKPTHGVLADGRPQIFHKGITYRVSRLICEAFNGPPPNPTALCLHVDEDASNNRAENLVWGTQKENLQAPGFLAYAKRAKRGPKITEAQAREVKYGCLSCAEASRKFGISPSTVSNIRAGRAWKHL